MIDKYRADLHIHTLLSPCADLKMTPANIVKKAKEEGLQIIGITDHNSTRNSKLVKQIGEREEVFVLTGAEVTTKEEVHCLAFFEEDKQLDKFQEFIDEHITIIPNKEDYLGYQPVVDENENILELVPHYLPAALNVGITEIQKAVEKLDGIFIPAHVDKPSNGIFSQLGYVPDNLSFDAFGISKNSTENEVRKHYVLDDNISLICNSDAHYLQQIGEAYTVFNIEEICFREIKMALNNRCKRFVETL